jgi:hypothetical protein
MVESLVDRFWSRLFGQMNVVVSPRR